MATFAVTTSNWNSPTFWSGINTSSAGQELDFSDLGHNYSITTDVSLGTITITYISSTFVVKDSASGEAADVTMGGSSLLNHFTVQSGSDGADTFEGSATADSILGGIGWDTLSGGGGNDTIDGGNGWDSLSGGVGNDTIDGGNGRDTLIGGDGNDTLDGGDEQDTLDGGAGDDVLDGGVDSARDTFFLSAGNDVITGSASGLADASVADQIDFSNATTGLTFTWTSTYDGTIQMGGDTTTFTNIGAVFNFDGTPTDDQFDGSLSSGGISVSDGVGGNDTVLGSEHTDYLSFGLSAVTEGNINITAGGGDDYIEALVMETANISGGSGNDDIIVEADNATVDGGDGNDTINYFGIGESVSLSGGGGNDTLYGWTGGETLAGGTGDDLISAWDGSDTIVVQDDYGNDTIIGGEGSGSDRDVLDARAILSSGIYVQFDGNESGEFSNFSQFVEFSEIEVLRMTDQADTVLANPTTSGIEVFGEGGNDILFGGSGNDRLEGGTGDDVLTGGAGDDFLKAGQGQDTLRGGEGDDTLMNAAGDDSLEGGAGDDLIVATQGDDTLIGGTGSDTLMGGTDNDSLDGGADNDLLMGDLAGVEFNTTDSDGAGIAANITDFPSTQLSYEMTFSSDVASGVTPLLSYATASEFNEFILVVLPSGEFGVRIENVQHSTGVSATPYFDGNIHTIGVTWESATGEIILYGDGVELYSGTHQTGSVLDQGGTIVLGQDQDSLGGGFDPAENFEGTIYGVRLYDDIRTPSELLDTVHAPVADTSDANLIVNWVADPDSATFTDQTGSYAMTTSGDVSATWSEGDDALSGGTGDDTIYGGGGSDTIVLEDSFGNDSIVGGEDGDGNDLDVIDLSAMTGPVTVTYTGHETGTITNGTDTITFSEIENFILTDHADSFDSTATSGDHSIDGGAGDDTLIGGFGDHTIQGGDGADEIFGGSGQSSIDAGSGDDTVHANFYPDAGEENAYEGGTGSDSFVVDGTPVEALDYDINLTTGVDNFANTYSGFETVIGGDGNDTLTGDGNDNLLSGGSGTDVIRGEQGNDTLLGGDGADTIEGGDGDDLIEGGDGDDLLRTGLGEDTIYGGAGNDTILNSDGDDSLDGGAGDDSIVATGGEDTLRGGTGDDTMEGGDDADTFIIEDNFGNDVIIGGEGTSDPIDADYDTLDLTALSGPVTVTYGDDNESGTITDGTDTLTFTEIEHIITTDQADSVDASDVYDGVYGDNPGISIETRDGDDTIVSGWGADTIDGGTGDDYIDGDYGDDSLIGGAGQDTLIGSTGNDTLEGGDGHDSIDGGVEGDVLTGGAGDDTIDGGDGDDVIGGGANNDSIDGGDGDDTLEGGTGDDTLNGGAGDDTFVYNAGDGNDTITDFNFGNSGAIGDGDTTNNDFIDLSQYYTNLVELRADFDDDGILNQSGDETGNRDYSDNTAMGGSMTFSGADRQSFRSDNTGVVCFTSGTRIATPGGAAPIEELREGDMVLTQDNGPQRILWIGRRRLGKRKLATAPHLKPIFLAPSLTGTDTPLIVSPQHGVLIRRNGEETLVRAKHLAEVQGVCAHVMRGIKNVTYFHILLERHEILFANGVRSESFYPGTQALTALKADAISEVLTIFPDLRTQSVCSTYGNYVREFAKKKSLCNNLQDFVVASGSSGRSFLCPSAGV